MSNYFCNAFGCSNSTLKKNNVEKYPWLKDVEFRSFPHATELEWVHIVISTVFWR